MGDSIYKIDIEGCEDALRVIYTFLTDNALTNPECTIFGAGPPIGGFPNILKVYGGSVPVPSYADFVRRTVKLDFSAISCVSATDPEDRRRVALSYIPALGYIALSFPMAVNGINGAEKQLLKRICR